MTWPIAVVLIFVMAAALAWRWLELHKVKDSHRGELEQVRKRVDVHDEKLRDLINKVMD